MNAIFISLITAATFLSACGGNKKSGKEITLTNDTVQTQVPVGDNTAGSAGSVNVLVTEYLVLKNALASDDGATAASAAKNIVDAISKNDEATFTPDQKKLFDDVKDDMKEHAEHISANAGKLDHQREHFDMLSQDMYDMVKVFKPSRALYQTHCPMYNDKKGASWLSETKEIKNPYYGKKMLDCGMVKEELKP